MRSLTKRWLILTGFQLKQVVFGVFSVGICGILLTTQTLLKSQQHARQYVDVPKISPAPTPPTTPHRVDYKAAAVVEVAKDGYGRFRDQHIKFRPLEKRPKKKVVLDSQWPHELHQDSVFVPHTGKDWTGTTDPFYFYIYSAIYDDRDNFGDARVAMIGIADKTPFNTKSVKCRMLFSDNKGGLDTSVSYGFQALTRDFNKDGVQVSTFLLWCPLQGHGANRKPKTVSLRYVSNTKGVSELCSVPVEYPATPEKQDFLGACVTAIYHPITGTLLEPIDVIEWIEMQMMLGVNHISVYVHSIHTSLLSVLQYYANSGVLSIRSAGPIAGDMFKMPRATSLADCMYRYMHSHKKVLVLDFDEFIIPRDNVTLIEMLESAAQEGNTTFEGTHFQFRNVDFFTDDPRSNTSTNARIFSHLRHAPPDPFKGPMKSIQDPQMCVFATNHYCLQTSLKAYTHYVNESTALCHHYRPCSFHRTTAMCSAAFESSSEDNILLRYEPTLSLQMEKTLQLLPAV